MSARSLKGVSDVVNGNVKVHFQPFAAKKVQESSTGLKNDSFFTRSKLSKNESKKPMGYRDVYKGIEELYDKWLDKVEPMPLYDSVWKK